MRRALAALLLSLGLVPSAIAQTGERADTARKRPPAQPQSDEHAGHDMSGGFRMPPMRREMAMPMIPGMQGVKPNVQLYMPGEGIDASTLPEAVPRKLVRMKDGDTLDLTAGMVRRKIHGKTHVMFGFNGQYPGPLIRVAQDATIIVRFTNRLDLPSAVHWHGVRLDNASDGAVGVTQDAVPPGGTFTYTVHFKDAGIFWYHPHVREDIQQALGLFGNMMVDSPDSAYYSPVNREEFLMLEDLLVDEEGILPFGKDAANFAIMGRFGNVMLVNGEPDYRLTVKRGEVVRFLLTDVSNTRMYNLSFGGVPLKLVAADLSKFEREEMTPNVVIAPAQRYVVEAKFDTPGTYAITNRVQALNNFLGEFVPIVDTLGTITVEAGRASADYSKAFATLRRNADVTGDIDRYRKEFGRAVDKELVLTVNMQGLPVPVTAFMSVDTMYFPPAEWADGMPDMNWVATSKEVRWIIRDVAAKQDNMDVHWSFKVGDVVKVRLHNDGQSMHPMSHPIHFHGQRFLILSRDGVPEDNLVWRDTAVLPVGTSADLLLELTNPGKWMVHCHIAEHLEAGMMMVFEVLE
jgi:FtsP/CotA-like multicopper oxidase with cupredoxin domain